MALCSALLGVSPLFLQMASAQPTLDRLEDELSESQPPIPAQSGDDSTAGERGYLGLEVDTSDELADRVQVIEVVRDGPAELGGIRAGDLIAAIDDKPVRNLDELARILAGYAPGQRLQISTERNGAPRQFEVRLGRSTAVRGSRDTLKPGGPTNQVAKGEPDVKQRRPLGIRTVPVTEAMRLLYDLPSTRGALVSELVVDSPAHRQGIPLDAVIVEAQGQAIATPQELAEVVIAASATGEIELGYYTRGELVRTKIRLDAPAEAPLPDPELAGNRNKIEAEIEPSTPIVGDEQARIEQLEARILQLERQLRRMESLLRESLLPEPGGAQESLPADPLPVDKPADT
jgi:hypothetical protein